LYPENEFFSNLGGGNVIVLLKPQIHMAAAVPILASVDLEQRLNRQPSSHSQRTGTCCSAIDEALHGGIESGRITCISGDKGTGKTTVGTGFGLALIISTACFRRVIRCSWDKKAFAWKYISST
jgi:predicted ATP-dependent serine protease